MSCDREALESFVLGELAAMEAAAVASHARACAECSTELRWLRTEQSAIGARARRPAEPLPAFESVLARSRAPVRNPSPPVRGLPSWAAGLATAAALLLALSSPARRAPVLASNEAEIVASSGAEFACAEPGWDEDEAISSEESTYSACLLASPGSALALDVCL